MFLLLKIYKRFYPFFLTDFIYSLADKNKKM